MKKIPSICSLLLGILAVTAQAEDLGSLTEQAKALIQPFQQELLKTLTQAMQSGGPSKAIEACQILAPQITEQHSQSPWTIGRTALKVRNPDNTADAWERQVLENFAQRAAAGEPIADLVYAEQVGKQFRMMKAIATAEPCLACHGQKIAPELQALLRNRYPQDQAQGFALGELRGAFTLKRTIQIKQLNTEANP